MAKNGTLPVNKRMCKTCPWRYGSPFAFLRPSLEEASMKTSRICHSTGSNNAINERTGKLPQLCRGSRNYQLQVLHGLGFLDAPTDECWERKWAEMSQ